VYAEGLRVYAEDLRLYAKGLRVYAEGLRVCAEDLHVYAGRRLAAHRSGRARDEGVNGVSTICVSSWDNPQPLEVLLISSADADGTDPVATAPRTELILAKCGNKTMRPKNRVTLYILILLTLVCCAPISAQNASVSVAKRASRIPKSCEGLVAASIEGPIDIPALVKEAYCKGDGDMLTEYTYVMTSEGRSIDKNGQTKQVSTTYEVFIPTLKSGTHGKGIMVVTSRNGVPVRDDELEKAQLEAGKRLEKAEEKNASETAAAPETAPEVKGMLPVGMYTHTSSNKHSSLGKSASAGLAIHTFLKTCELTLARREQHEGRETLIFNFTPRPGAQFADNEKYIAQLTGEIWIDAQDRIVLRLVGRPTLSARNPSPAPPVPTPGPTATEGPPAVYVEMMRLPEGIWLPRIIRINGADYQNLFDGITWETTSTFSNFKRFSTEIKDVKINSDSKP